MKNLVLTLGLFIALSTCAMADDTQNQPTQTAAPVETVTVNRADLTPEQLAKIDAENRTKEVTTEVQTVNEWTGMGKEIGISIKEGLGAASDGVSNFAATPPGKLTMFLIAWKVMYKDVFDTLKILSGVIIGVPLLVFFDTCLMLALFRSIRPRKVLLSTEGWFKKKTYEYQETWFTSMSDDNSAKPVTLGFFFFFCFVSNAIMIGAVIFR